MNQNLVCKEHNFQPITYLTTQHTEPQMFLYERQCMNCGQKEPTPFASDKILQLHYPYTIEKFMREIKKDHAKNNNGNKEDI